MRRSAARALVPALVVLGLLAVVAVAATGSTSGGTGRTRPPASTFLDAILTLGLLGVVAGGILFAYGLTLRREISREIASGRYRRTSLVGWILFVFAFTAYAYWRGSWKLRPTGPSMEDVLPPDERTNAPAGTTPDATGTTYEPSLSWITIAAVLALVAAAVAAWIISERRARRRVARRDSLVEEVSAVLDETLDDLRAESDPRRAVIAAYVKLERVLSANGVPRDRAETEEEYLARFLRSLDVSETSGRRLTELFERARFSQHAVDHAMKDEAIGALEQLRDELRRAREARDAPPRVEVAAGGAA
ncbi:MAG TPA: DUF4129 domain-containing protein [Gaiellaceae bacterium]|nr:DUF4129 domain-containing protein [Gaiellaceae bacterium]